MMRPSLTSDQKAAVRAVLAQADLTGRTQSWEPALNLEVSFLELPQWVTILNTLRDLEDDCPGLLSVVRNDPVVRFEAVAPRVTVWLGSWARDLVAEGFFHE